MTVQDVVISDLVEFIWRHHLQNQHDSNHDGAPFKRTDEWRLAVSEYTRITNDNGGLSVSASTQARDLRSNPEHVPLIEKQVQTYGRPWIAAALGAFRESPEQHATLGCSLDPFAPHGRGAKHNEFAAEDSAVSPTP